jgi:TolB protein
MRLIRSLWASGTVVLVLLVVLSACGQTPPATAPSATAAAELPTLAPPARASEPAATETASAPTAAPATATEPTSPPPSPAPTAAGAQPGLSPLPTPSQNLSPLQPTPTSQDGQAASAPAPAEPAQGKIAWHSDRSGQIQIWVMDDNGANSVQITKGGDEGTNAEPAWSPDGEQLAFVSDRDSEEALQIYFSAVDGSDARPLMPMHESHNWSPDWSPDGKALLFQSNRDNGNFELYSVNGDGTGLKNLTNDKAQDGRGRWSPDGKQIVFASDRAGSNDIWVMDAGGANLRQLTKDEAVDDHPRLSPDGNEIIFVRKLAGSDTYRLFVMGADGVEPERVGDFEGNVTAPSWARGGRSILFSATLDGANWDLYMVDRDGGNLRAITSGPEVDRFAVWFPAQP